MSFRMAMAKKLQGIMQHQLRSVGTGPTKAGPKMSTYAPAFGSGGHATRPRNPSLKEQLFPKGKPVGDYVPVYVALGMIALSVALGLHTAKQQLMHSPDVRVKKSRRETLPEVVEPEHVAHESEEFIKKSLFRKVAHVQEFEKPVHDHVHGNPLQLEPRVESLKTVGVDPAAGNSLRR